MQAPKKETIIRALILLFSIGLITVGFTLINDGLKKANDTLPSNTIPEINNYYFQKTDFGTIFSVKTETVGAYVAENPINVTITTNRLDVRSVQLQFLGASHYFPNNTQPIYPQFPDDYSQASIESYEKALDDYNKQLDQQTDKIMDNILILTNDTNVQSYDRFYNTTYSNYPTYSGEIKNLTYTIGGKFSIGVTVILADGNVVGYGMGDTSYVISDYVEIAPPETLLQIQSNNITIGLSYIAIGITPLLSGSLLIVELIKPYTKSNKTTKEYENDWE